MITMSLSRIGAACRALVFVTLGSVSCGLDKQTAPDLTGPSEFGLSLKLAVQPDMVPRDGESQATVIITALDTQGAAVSGKLLRVGSSPSAVVVSSSEVTTDARGQATVTITAPPSWEIAAHNEIVVYVMPSVEDYGNAVDRSVTIGLLGPSNETLPTASFVFAPAAPKAGDAIVFDASATTDEGAVCTTCTYEWAFGNGATAVGTVVTHSFGTKGTFAVTLTVTDSMGSVGKKTQPITVAEADEPEASTASIR